MCGTHAFPPSSLPARTPHTPPCPSFLHIVPHPSIPPIHTHTPFLKGERLQGGGGGGLHPRVPPAAAPLVRRHDLLPLPDQARIIYEAAQSVRAPCCRVHALSSASLSSDHTHDACMHAPIVLRIGRRGSPLSLTHPHTHIIHTPSLSSVGSKPTRLLHEPITHVHTHFVVPPDSTWTCPPASCPTTATGRWSPSRSCP